MTIKTRRWAGALAALAVIGGLAGCGSAAASGSSTSTPAAAAPVTTPPTAQAPAASSPDCNAQVASWRDNGALAGLKAIGADLGTVAQASTGLATALQSDTGLSDAESALQTAAASLQADVQSAQSDLPPDCVPGLRQHERAALTEFDRAAINSSNTVSAVENGDYSAADGDIQAANAAMIAGTGKLKVALSDVNQFNGS